MKVRHFGSTGLLLGLTAVAVVLFMAPAPAMAAPAYDIRAGWGDTNLPPGGEAEFYLQARNVGDEVAEENLTITDQFPAEVTITKIDWPEVEFEDEKLSTEHCSGIGTNTLTCTLPGSKVMTLAKPVGVGSPPFSGLIPNGYLAMLYVDVAVDPGATGTAVNTATISGGGASQAMTDVDQVPFSSMPSPFGVVPGTFAADAFDAPYPAGEPSRQAGDHPSEYRFNFDLTEEGGVNETLTNESLGKRYVLPTALAKDVEGTLPRGMIGNPEALPKCDPTDFGTTPLGAFISTACPSDTQIGVIDIWLGSGVGNHGQGAFSSQYGDSEFSRVAIYNLEPPKGQVIDLGFNAGVLVLGHIYATVDPAQNYAIKSVSPEISSFLSLKGAQVTLWGVPGDPVHDKLRYYPQFQEFMPEETLKFAGAPWGSAPIRPFFTNPMDCGFDNGGSRIRVDSYSDPGNYTPAEEYGDPMNVEGCDDPRFRFEPDVALQPTSRDAGGPTGLDVNLRVPQRNDEVSNAADLYAENGKVKGIATPPIKKVVVTLPQGMTVSPSAAQGLSSCSPEQIGLGTNDPVRCPDSSQFGTLTLHTPLLPVDSHPKGIVYIAKQNDNPFHNFLSLYLVIAEPERNLLVKIPGRVDLDPQTGQITSTFDDLPQVPSSDVQLSLKGGLRAGLVNPQTCGTKTIEATFYSWHDPSTPHTVKSNFEVTQNQDGSPCFNSASERPFDPDVSGGTVNNLAGAYSPMEIQLIRSDEDQELSRVEGTSPPGLLASLKGVGRCSDAAIAAAANPDRTGTEEINSPSCPASSLVGTVDAGAGVGQVLTYVGGKIYLAGPYKGAPVSGVAIVPAVAGPFDLGVIVTRAPGYVNPKTAELHLVSDPLPLIFKGVPVRVRDIQLHLNRNRFILNPTNCEPFTLSGTLFSSEGKSKASGSPFQAADCASLGFKPRLTTRLFGGTHRGSHPKFRGVFKAREGDANAASAVVTLPRSEFLDQSHIRTVCTRVQFAANQCPPGSIYGHAVATTPLLEEELQGPVYLRSSDHKLPDLVANLHGIVDVEVVGRVDSIGGGIRASFESIPDAPVEQFTITMQGGKKGLLVNSRNICAQTYRINAEFKGQNGKEANLHPKLEAKCGAKRKAKRR